MIICKFKPFTLRGGWCDGATQCADPPAQRFKIVVLFPVICIFTLMYLVSCDRTYNYNQLTLFF